MTQLTIYNQALLMVGERALESVATSDIQTPQKELDIVWDNGAIEYCLEQALWNFASRTVSISYNPSITPAFGYKYVFDKPTDWVRTSALCADADFYIPLIDARDKGSYWHAHIDTIYVEYISIDDEYGNDMSLWPRSFEKVMVAYLAKETCEKITQSRVKKADMELIYQSRLLNASTKDAFNQSTKRPAPGGWVRSRAGGSHRERPR